MNYVHVGTGNSYSTNYCEICDGYYGVPHDNIHTGPRPHPLRDWPASVCACRPCQEKSGRYPNEGVFLTDAELIEHFANDPRKKVSA